MGGAFSRTHAIIKMNVGYWTNADTYDGYCKKKKPAVTNDKCCLQKSEMYCVNQFAQLTWILYIVFVQIYPAVCFPGGCVIESFIIFVGRQKFYKNLGWRICILNLSIPLLASLTSIKFSTVCGMTEGKKYFVLGPHLDFCLYWDKKKVKRKTVKFDFRCADYILYYLLPSFTVNSSHLSVTVSSVSSNFYFDIPQIVIIWRYNVSKIIRFRIAFLRQFSLILIKSISILRVSKMHIFRIQGAPHCQ